MSTRDADNRRFVQSFQDQLAARGLYKGEADGWAGSKTSGALGVILRNLDGNVPQVAKIGHGYNAGLDFLASWEGHIGRPYWPGGISGVTLDPGFDLGYVEPSLVSEVYGQRTLDLARPALGVRGRAAEALLGQPSTLLVIRVSEEQAEAALPVVARPYWIAVSARFPGLLAAPAGVQEAMLSLAYNRGARNRHLAVLSEPIRSGDWSRLADIVGGMQQNHKLAGVSRRRREEAELMRRSAG